MKQIRIENTGDLERAAREFVAEAMQGDATVFAFRGAMGAGKTTFINALARVLGVDDSEEATGSPTFAIINEYRSATTAELIYHFDLYRIESLDEALDLGIEDYFMSGALCLLEWPENIADLLPDDTVVVDLAVNDDGSRTLTIN